jgi:hypothetical protein
MFGKTLPLRPLASDPCVRMSVGGKDMVRPRIISVQRIWGGAPHCAFTDLVRFRKGWYCAFREAEDHVGSLGRVRLLASADGRRWITAALIAEKGVDLRDPKLSIAPGRKLMLLMGGSAYSGGKYTGRQPRVAFSEDGTTWSSSQRILSEGDWMWRATWFKGRVYGVSYRLLDENRWTVALHDSADGLKYRATCELSVGGKPNEATIRFFSDGRARAIVRREGADRQAWIGSSRPPYRAWTWKASGHRMGGPDLIVLPDGRVWAAGRTYVDGQPCVTLGPLSVSRYAPALVLPSAGDCGYPGLAWYGGFLWVSYYSSHEGSTSIYLARLRMD